VHRFFFWGGQDKGEGGETRANQEKKTPGEKIKKRGGAEKKTKPPKNACTKKKIKNNRKIHADQPSQLK
jgi:hypothetical protein